MSSLSPPAEFTPSAPATSTSPTNQPHQCLVAQSGVRKIQVGLDRFLTPPLHIPLSASRSQLSLQRGCICLSRASPEPAVEGSLFRQGLIDVAWSQLDDHGHHRPPTLHYTRLLRVNDQSFPFSFFFLFEVCSFSTPPLLQHPLASGIVVDLTSFYHARRTSLTTTS